MELPKVAIIYLTYNGKDSYRDITRCLQSIEKITYPLDQVELICVENPSPHGASWPFIGSEWGPKSGNQFPHLTIVKNPKDVGYAGANNVGIAEAKKRGCSYAFLLNQDADVDPNFLTAAVARAEQDEKVMFVQSLVLLGQDKQLVNSVGNRLHFLGYGYAGGFGWTHEQAKAFFVQEQKENPDLEVPYFSGAAVLVRLSMTDEIGLFDSDFYMYHEDVDASLNARVHGYKSVVAPESIIYHYYEFSKSIKKFYWMERNRLIVLLTYYKLPTLLLITVPFFGVELVSFLLAIKSGWWKEKIRAWLFFFKPSSLAWIWRRRRQAQSTRLITDRELLKRAESTILFQKNPVIANTDHAILNDVRSSIVTRVGNPLMQKMWAVIYTLIHW